MIVSSHLDAGWLSTVDQYYTGDGTPWGESAREIFDTIVAKLEENGDWTYALSEVCFFSRWWNEQTGAMQQRVKQLLNKKQLEFVNGGWVAHDEATTTYEDMLENLNQGSVWLRNNLGIEVDIGWQLDSFGTSSTHASLLAQAGYRILFFSRDDFIDRQWRRANQELEFIWKPANPLNKTLLTHIFGFEYGSVPYLERAPYISQVFGGENLKESDYDEIEAYINQESKVFKSPNILFTMVGDFYVAAYDYDGMQGIVDHFRGNDSTNISVEFSTLTKFTDNLYHDLDINTLPTKSGDFFPYIQDWGGSAWTGYFTSKPNFKIFVRATSHYLNAIRSLYLRIFLTFIEEHDYEQYHDLWAALTNLGQVLSVLQHHDAITGTSKEKVRHDYEHMVIKSIQEVESHFQPLMAKFINVKYSGHLGDNKKSDENSADTREENKQPEQQQQPSHSSEQRGVTNSSFKTTTQKSDKDRQQLQQQLILDPISWSNRRQLKHKIKLDETYFDIPLSIIEDSYHTEEEEPYLYVFTFNPGIQYQTMISLSLPKRDVYNLRIKDDNGQEFSPDIFCLSIPNDSCYMRWIDHFAKFETKIYKVFKDPGVSLSPIVANKLEFPSSSEDDTSASPTLSYSKEIKITERASLSLQSDYQTLLLKNCQSPSSLEGQTSQNCQKDHIVLKYMYYVASDKSGAYAFDPNPKGAKTPILSTLNAHVYQGQYFLILEIFNQKVSSQLIFQRSNYLEDNINGFELISFVEGSIADKVRCEIILCLKYLDDLIQTSEEGGRAEAMKNDNNSTSNVRWGNNKTPQPNRPFYVDTNGYYLTARTYGEKDNPILTSGKNIAHNFYPMTTMVAINDTATAKRMTVITDRAQGVTYNPSGEIEIMIHRIPKEDDQKGVNEPLDEKEELEIDHLIPRDVDTSGVSEPLHQKRLNVTTRHFILLTDALDSISQAHLRSLAYEQPLQLWKFYNSSYNLSDNFERVQRPGTNFSKQTSHIQEEEEEEESNLLNYLKLQVIDSNEKHVVLVRIHNIHDTKALQFRFCEENNYSLSEAFRRMLGSPPDNIQIETMTEQHLTNHKALSSLSCANLIQFLPKEIKTFGIQFRRILQSKTNNDFSDHHNGGDFVGWKIVILVLVCSTIYLGFGLRLGKFLMSKDVSIRPTGYKQIVCLRIILGLLWPLVLLIVIALSQIKLRRQRNLVGNDAENQIKHEKISFEDNATDNNDANDANDIQHSF